MWRWWPGSRAVVFIEGDLDARVISVVLAYLVLVVWWRTRRARSKPVSPTIEGFRTRGVLWGAVAGFVF